MTERPDEWDDNPEWTDDDFKRAKPTEQVVGKEAASILTRPKSLARYFSGQQRWITGKRLAA